MSFKKRKTKLWNELGSLQKRADKLVDDTTKSGISNDIGTLFGFLDSVEPMTSKIEGRDMLQFCREELDKIKEKLFGSEKAHGTEYRDIEPLKYRKNKPREIGFHASKVGSFSLPSFNSSSTPKMNDVKFVDNVVCLKEGKNSVFKLIFNKETYSKMMMYTKLLDVEITGLLEVEIKNNQILLNDIHIFRQKVSGAQCEMEDDLAICEVMDKMIKAGKNPGSLKCWWHSHNTMGVSPSGTDVKTAEKFANGDFLLTLITNHRGEMYTKLNFYKPLQFEIEDLGIYVDYSSNMESILQECKDNITNMVKNSYCATVVKPFNNGNGYDYSSYHEFGYGGYGGDDGYPLFPGYDASKTPPIPVPTKQDDKLKRSVVGDCYNEGVFKYIWNREKSCYEVFTNSGEILSDEDKKAFGTREIENDLVGNLKEV